MNRKTNTHQNDHQPPRGQALVEFAILLPMLLLLILGAMDFGRLFSTKVTLTNAAREGANYISRNSTEAGNVYAVIATEIDNLTNYQVTYEFGVDEVYGTDYVSVEITKSVDLIFGNFLNFGPIPISSTVEMRLQ